MTRDQNLRLLYIEDDEHLCLLFKERMQEDGYSVDFALSAEAGLKKFHTNSYSLVVSDYDLPDRTGLVLRRTKTFSAHWPIFHRSQSWFMPIENLSL